MRRERERKRSRFEIRRNFKGAMKHPVHLVSVACFCPQTQMEQSILPSNYRENRHLWSSLPALPPFSHPSMYSSHPTFSALKWFSVEDEAPKTKGPHMMSTQMCLLALTRRNHCCGREGFETYLCLAPVSPLSCMRMRSDLVENKKRSYTLFYNRLLCKLGLDNLPCDLFRFCFLECEDELFLLFFLCDSFLFSLDNLWGFAFAFTSFLLQIEIELSTNSVQNEQPENTAWNPMCGVTLLHAEYPHPHFTGKVESFCWVPQHQRTVGGARNDFKGKARVGFRLGWRSRGYSGWLG